MTTYFNPILETRLQDQGWEISELSEIEGSENWEEFGYENPDFPGVHIFQDFCGGFYIYSE